MQPTRRLGRAVLSSPRGYRLPIWSCSGWGLPCRPGRPNRGELLPRLFTLTRRPQRRRGTPVGVRSVQRESGGIFSVALSLGSPPLGVTQHPALRSSDFPPSGAEHPTATALPASILLLIHGINYHNISVPCDGLSEIGIELYNERRSISFLRGETNLRRHGCTVV